MVDCLRLRREFVDSNDYSAAGFPSGENLPDIFKNIEVSLRRSTAPATAGRGSQSLVGSYHFDEAQVSGPTRESESLCGVYWLHVYANGYHRYTRLHRRPPAETDMQQYFRVSLPSVHQMVLTLERAGFILRKPRPPANCSLILNSCRSYFDRSYNRSKSLCSGTSNLRPM
jgi:hypothetical protein